MENNSYNLNQTDKIKPAVIGGSIMAIISTVPFLNMLNCLCCAGVMFGGFSAVYFYKKSLPENENLLKTKYGSILGAFAGVVGAMLETLITVFIIKFFSNTYFDNAYIEIEKRIDQLHESGSEIPLILIQLQDTIASFAQEIAEHGFSLVLTIVILVFNTFKNVLFGLLGGLLGVSILQRKNQQQPNNSNNNNYIE